MVKNYWAGVKNLQNQLFSIVGSALFAAGLWLVKRYFLGYSWRGMLLTTGVLRDLKPVDTAAALASGSTTQQPLSQPWARVLPLFLCSGPSPFEATRQPSSGPSEAADLRPNPLTGTTWWWTPSGTRRLPR